MLALCLWNSPQAAATSDLPEQFVSIKQFLLDTVSESQRIGAATTQALLQSNLIAFQQLKLRVDEASRMDDIIEELSIELDRIAANFEEAASMRRDYHKYTRKSNRQLNEKRHETRDAISEIDQHIAEKTREMEQARLALPNAKSDIERDRYQMTINANQSVLHSLQTQIDIWQRFDSAQARLLSTLKISTERVDYVLFVLEKNAQVYREAANTAKLRNNVRLALTDLQALGGIESSLIDLAASWREVDQIVKEIGRQEFFSNARS
ncbi:hypothetical protein AB833_18500 [Chromatiales bacterium (ex Bugula neritina AB1)]|nr:hypothetical protein AB833_18500 [Chromatiales bacterium (ex Bugula neritina AB1)]